MKKGNMIISIILALCILPVLSVAEEEKNPYDLPLDIGYIPPKAQGEFTAASYHDDSLDVKIEEIAYGRSVFYLAHITVASPTQLRTAEDGEPNVSSKEKPSLVGRKKNAVLIINGEYYTQRTSDSFIVRQGRLYKNKPDPEKDVLIIDAAGDFHVFCGEDKTAQINGYLTGGGTIVNAFSFGPAFSDHGEAVPLREGYSFYPEQSTQRTLICQEETREDGRRVYCFVYAIDATHKNLYNFVTHVNESGEYGFKLLTAYNLDGGNSSILLFNGRKFGLHENPEREVKDIIYVVSAVSE